MLENCWEDLLPLSHKSISEVGHWCWAFRPGSRSVFQFIPKVFTTLPYSLCLAHGLTSEALTTFTGHFLKSGVTSLSTFKAELLCHCSCSVWYHFLALRLQCKKIHFKMLLCRTESCWSVTYCMCRGCVAWRSIGQSLLSSHSQLSGCLYRYTHPTAANACPHTAQRALPL